VIPCLRNLRYLDGQQIDEDHYVHGSGAVPLDQEIDEELTSISRCARASWSMRGMDPAAARELVLARIGDLGKLNARASTSEESEIVRMLAD
jgi:hypothetical protein